MNNRVCAFVVGMSMVIFGWVNLGSTSFMDSTITDRQGQFEDTWIWEKLSHGMREPKVTRIAVGEVSSLDIFAGTTQAVYRWAEQSRSFLPFFYLEGGDEQVNDLYLYESTDHSAKEIFIVTRVGLYGGNLETRPERIFYFGSGLDKVCYAVRADEQRIYLATSEGLYFRARHERTWNRFKGILGLEPVYLLGQDDQYLYVVLADKVFRMHRKSGETREIFSVIARQFDTQDLYGEDQGDEELGGLQQQIRCLAFFKEGEAVYLYIGTDSGIFVSQDQGLSWESVLTKGLPIEQITSLVVIDKDHYWAGTLNGVFVYRAGVWMSMYRGLESNQTHDLAKDREGIIFAGTSGGLFKTVKDLRSSLSQGFDYQSVVRQFDHEPSILETQSMAIDYAEVHPQKISEWRRQVKQRAWFPELDVGIDGDDNLTRADSIWGSYTSGGTHYIGPDDKTSYDNLGWSVSLSWDLADLVWSSAQTSIDTRSKLVVELRESILNQVTRLYFERRRLQIESFVSDIQDAWTQLDRQLRVDELTATLDALTGGGFSSFSRN